jgi:hypothetical protein
MIIKITLLVYLIVLYIVEGFTDYNIWRASDPNKYEFTKKWHVYDFMFHDMVAILICYLFHGFSWEGALLLFNIGIIRYLFLNITLNKLRGKAWYYLSKDSNFIDKLLKKNEKVAFISAIIIGMSSWAYYIYL